MVGTCRGAYYRLTGLAEPGPKNERRSNVASPRRFPYGAARDANVFPKVFPFTIGLNCSHGDCNTGIWNQGLTQPATMAQNSPAGPTRVLS